jgi:hypothetical protein
MLCLACGAEMILVQVVKDTTMFVPGYEHHTWQCSGCSTVERRMTFTREKTPTQAVAVEPTQTMPVEPTQSVPPEPIQTVPVEPTHMARAEPAQTVPVEPTQAARVEPSQTTPAETTVSVEATKAVRAELTIRNRQPPRFQKNAWAKALEKLQKRETAARETERRAQFNRFWDDLRSVPPPSASSEALSHVKPDEPVRSPTEPIASPAPTAHDEPIAPESKSERARRLR